MKYAAILGVLFMTTVLHAQPATVEVTSVAQLAEVAAKSDQVVKMKPGVYKMSDYLTDEVMAAHKQAYPKGQGRQPAWMIHFSGSRNNFDFTDVVLEIQTELYPKLPGGTYVRMIFISGDGNTLKSLTVRNTGPQQGTSGNVLSVFGNGNTLENVSLYVHGSKPFAYGDLLGKGGPNLMHLQKQSGMMFAGRDNTARRCKVISRAFGHCFYIQRPGGMVTDNIRLEDCYAEGVMRSTADMLRETDGPLAKLNFGTIAENRDGRFLVVAGYMKSLVEDGFRTYGGTDRVQLINCTAVNTRAGFEVNGPDTGDGKTLVEGCTAIGCERAYLLGSNVLVRNSRGDTKYGPLLYLRGGINSQVDLELTGQGSDFTVHALATIAGEGHRVRLFTREPEGQQPPAVPIMLGFAMPAHAEMASPIKPAAAKGITLINQIPRVPVIKSAEAVDVTVESPGAVLDDEVSKKLPKK